MAHPRFAMVLFGLSLSACSCEPEPTPLVFPEGCSPLLHEVDCGLPYPSDYFLVDDESMPSSKRIAMRAASKLVTTDARSGDVNDSWAADGFSRVPPIVLSFGVRVDGTALPGIFDDPSQTLQAGFATALIEADSGRRIPHFIDVDPAEDATREALVIRPLDVLEERTRYVVAVSGLRTPGGDAVGAPEAFRRLRDARVGEDAVLRPMLARYEREIFPVVAAAGIERETLQLAWDFTTGSDERVMSDLLTARATVLAALSRDAPAITIDEVIEGPGLEDALAGDVSEVWRLVRGSVTGPRVVDSDAPGARLVRDETGSVIQNGETTFSFTAIIPTSVRDAGSARGALLYGHGFFGRQTELEDPSVRVIAQQARRTALSIDWIGMSREDVGTVVAAVGGELSQSAQFGERTMQSILNWHTLTHAIERGSLSEIDAFQLPEAHGGASVLDGAEPIAFVGNSMGHILGGTLTALNPHIGRSVLIVGGASLSTIMFRARPFASFLFLLGFSLPDPLDQQKLAAQMQTQLDRFDPATWARFVVSEDLPLGPSNNHRQRQVLEMIGIGDAQVPNVSGELHARMMGIPQLTPHPQSPVFGLEQRGFPVAGSGFVVYDLGVDPSFYEVPRPAADGNIVHDGVRRVPQALEQIRVFLEEGTIVDVCGGPCVIDGAHLGASP